MDNTKPSPQSARRRCGRQDCDRPHFGRGLCNAHYMQERRATTAQATARISDPDLPGEEWRPVPGYEGRYEASDLGRVRSVERTITDSLGRARRLKGCVLQPAPCRRKGRILYLSLQLGDHNSQPVHQVVLRAFVGPAPDGLEVCHNNGDPTDNRLENLRYDTRSANHLDKQRHGTDIYRNRTCCPRSHPLAGPNLKPSALKLGHRECLACSRARNRVRYYASIGGVSINMQEIADWYYQQIVQ